MDGIYIERRRLGNSKDSPQRQGPDRPSDMFCRRSAPSHPGWRPRTTLDTARSSLSSINVTSRRQTAFNCLPVFRQPLASPNTLISQALYIHILSPILSPVSVIKRPHCISGNIWLVSEPHYGGSPRTCPSTMLARTWNSVPSHCWFRCVQANACPARRAPL